MKPCSEIQPLLLDRAAGALPPETETRLTGHLETCLACRAEAKALDEALSLAGLPPPSEAERQVLDGLAGETLRAFRKDRARRTLWRGVGAGMAIAAAAAAVVLVLPVMRHGKGARTPSHSVAQTAAVQGTANGTAAQGSWQEPDLDAVWEASGAIVSGSSDADASDETPIFADVDFDSM